jgi:hypothetical protein
MLKVPDAATDRSSIDVNIEDREEDSNSQAPRTDELALLDLLNIPYCSVRGRNHDASVLWDTACRVAKEEDEERPEREDYHEAEREKR